MKRSRVSSKRQRGGASKRYRKRGGRGYTRTVGYYGRYNASPGSELKFFDGIEGANGSDNNGEIVQDSLVHIVQGPEEDQRIGRKCTIKSIHMRGQFILSTATNPAIAGDRVRVIVYQDKQTNGATATVANLLQTSDIDSFRNLENSGRFKYLLDKTYTLNAMAASGNGSTDQTFESVRHFKWDKNCNIPIEYSATTGSMTEIRSNNIGVMMIPHVSNISTFAFHWRVRYIG